VLVGIDHEHAVGREVTHLAPAHWAHSNTLFRAIQSVRLVVDRHRAGANYTVRQLPEVTVSVLAASHVKARPVDNIGPLDREGCDHVGWVDLNRSVSPHRPLRLVCFVIVIGVSHPAWRTFPLTHYEARAR
jgi:hypothetical protein